MSISFIICERGMLLGKKESQKAMLSEHYFLLEEAGPGGRQGGAHAPNFFITEDKYVSNRHTIKVCISCSWWCTGTSLPCVPHPVILVSSRYQSNACVMDEGLWRALFQLKEPFKGPRPTLGSCLEEWSITISSPKEVIDLPSRQINHFYFPIWLP